MKRVFLFLITNLAIVFVLAVALRVLGLEWLLFQYGIDFWPLLAFSFIFGMGGAFISLRISKWTAKRWMGLTVIDEPQNNTEIWLVNTVQNYARAANIAMPEVAVYDSPEPNAFATGPSRNNSLVAVSTGLLRSMKPDQASAVLGHEVSHVANGDMVTLTLLQGVLNTFVIFLSRVIGYVVDRALHRDGEGGYGMGYFVTVIVTQILLGILASLVVSWYSRRREYRADAGGAYLAGKPSMIGALEALQRSVEPEHMPEQLEAMGIAGVRKGGLRMLFASHPPLEDRIAALREERHAAGT
ncbi:MAG: protease HtpX [Deltaproteobacteria bacterium]|nr:protease HtpX [Deltaproteobacteria bacterium]